MDNYCIKLSGRAELPEKLEVDKNYVVGLEGTVTNEDKSSNDDGSFTFTYKLKPVTVQITKETGQTIKAKDIRSRAQQFRGVLWKEWKDGGEKIEFEDYYDREMIILIRKRISGEL